MFRIHVLRSLAPAISTLMMIPAAASSTAGKGIWSKKGVAFFAGCGRRFKECKPLRILSPDGKSVVAVTYATNPEFPDVETASLDVTTLGKVRGHVQPVASVENEVVWSPDSKAFFISGNNNANGSDDFAVFFLDEPALGARRIKQDVEKDMVRSFPPCKAAPPPISNCAEVAEDPDFAGVLAIDWNGDSARIVVIAEVTCSSSMGGIMCQVLGYELDARSGRILRRMEPKEFARSWQHSMAWKFRIPDPPAFLANTQ